MNGGIDFRYLGVVSPLLANIKVSHVDLKLWKIRSNIIQISTHLNQCSTACHIKSHSEPYIRLSYLFTVRNTSLLLGSFGQGFAGFKATALFFLTQLTSIWSVWPLGGAPNYYPNSFSAPDTQPSCIESKFKVFPDVARYNSADEDNVAQVKTKARLFVLTE